MSHFSKDFIDFFKELGANNDRDWFNAEKKRYEKSVKKPFEAFIADLIKEVQKKEPQLNPAPKNTIFRIHKDTRFSKDKTPYKLHASAIISPQGRKDKAYPGYYLQLGADTCWIGGGAYFLEKEMLEDMRFSLEDQPGELSKLLSDKDFKKYFGELKGEQYKVLPKEWKEKAENEPLLYYKQFYYMAEIPAKKMLEPDFLQSVLDHFKAARPVNDYLVKALYH